MTGVCVVDSMFFSGEICFSLLKIPIALLIHRPPIDWFIAYDRRRSLAKLAPSNARSDDAIGQCSLSTYRRQLTKHTAR